MQRIDNPQGNYRFLTGIAPFSSGVIAMPGYEIVHATLHQPIPYQQGFDLVAQHLVDMERPRQALCAMELRSPKSFTFAGFDEFNAGYQEIIAAWDLLVEGRNPVARTNIAPEAHPPEVPSLYAFSYTVPTNLNQPSTFVIAGAGDLRGTRHDPEDIVRRGETSVNAIREKATHVMDTMQARLSGLQASWSQVTAVDIYTVFPLQPYLAGEILSPMGPAAIHSVHWYYGRPPIIGLEFEMDMRGVRQEIRLGWGK
ncbi:MAG: RidA family protein [Chloroflexota bacterium]